MAKQTRGAADPACTHAKAASSIVEFKMQTQAVVMCSLAFALQHTHHTTCPRGLPALPACPPAASDGASFRMSHSSCATPRTPLSVGTGTRLTHAAVAKHGGVKPEALAHLHAARKEAVAVGTHAVHASDATTAKPPKHAHTEASKSYGSSKERSRVLARFKLKEGVCISVRSSRNADQVTHSQ